MAKHEIIGGENRDIGELLLKKCELDVRNNLTLNLLDIYMLISIIETYLANIGDSIPINKVTLRSIGNIYKQRNWDRNDGLFGQCFERAVYNCILTNKDNITDWIKIFLSELDHFDDEENIEVILWGNEKGNWVYDENKHLGLSLIKDSDFIEINNISYNFKKVLNEISIRSKAYGGLGKADLFVKQKNSHYWYGVSVKLNVEDLY